MSYVVEASTSDPATREGYAKDNLANYQVCHSRPQAAEQAARFFRSGYWVEVYHQESGELMAGPIDPDQPLPKYIV